MAGENNQNQMFDSALQLPISYLTQKAAIGTDMLPNSVLNRQQADRFIDLVIDQSKLTKMVRTKKVDFAKGDINKLDIGDIATEGAATTSTNTTTGVSESVIKYDMEKYRSAFDLKADFMEDNLEGSAIRDRLLGMFSKRIAMDSELALIESDDDLTTGDGQTRRNNLLGVNNGLRKLLLANIPSGQVLDAGGKAPTKRMFYDGKRMIPTKYRVARPNYVWLVPPSVFDKWVLEWTDRETAQGDQTLQSGIAPGPLGIGLVEVPMFPEDINYTAHTDYDYLGVSGGTSTDMILTPLDNIIFFMQRDLTIEWQRIPRRDTWEVTIYWKGDFAVENPDLVVYVKNINAEGADYTG